MPYFLKNKDIEVQIDHPLEDYSSSRFDWTGKITEVKYRGKCISTNETKNKFNPQNLGRGFYNEFGIESPLGFEKTKLGGWFHKIGIGLLKKEDDQYLFSKNYEIIPAEFEVHSLTNSITIICRSKSENGYAYTLKKEIELLSDGFIITYKLENTGEKEIETDEYTHNFIAIDNDLLGKNYILRFPFEIKQDLFSASVNPGKKVDISNHRFSFNGCPEEQFFFSSLSGHHKVAAKWEIHNLKAGISIKEIGNFKTDKINLWGWQHVISPELFYKVSVRPGQVALWSRTFSVFQIKNQIS